MPDSISTETRCSPPPTCLGTPSTMCCDVYEYSYMLGEERIRKTTRWCRVRSRMAFNTDYLPIYLSITGRKRWTRHKYAVQALGYRRCHLPWAPGRLPVPLPVLHSSCSDVPDSSRSVAILICSRHRSPTQGATHITA